jgi:hypothetical protein
LPLPQQAGANIRGAGLFGALLTSDAVLGQGKDGQRIFVEFTTLTWVVARQEGPLFSHGFLSESQALVVPNIPGATYSNEVNHLIEAGTEFTRGLKPWTDERNTLTSLLF